MEMVRREFLGRTGLAAIGLVGLNLLSSPFAGAVDSAGISFAHNENPLGSDVDVLDSHGQPMFRVLLPEAVWVENVAIDSFLSHVTPGAWGYEEGVHWGVIQNPEWVEVRVALVPHNRGALILFCVKNLSQQLLEGVKIDVCVSVSHLPCPKGNWINPDFLDVPAPYDRDEAGRYWYERVAPSQLKALVSGKWLAAHPTPQSPSAEGVPRYKPFRYLDTPASVLAAESLDGTKRLFQAWDRPCQVRYPFPGNSCMHLGPRVSELLAPGDTSCLRGQIAVTDDDWDQISRWNSGQYRDEFKRMKSVLEHVPERGSEAK